MLTIIEPGISNTIQDAGRWGFQSLGVPVSGAMDVFAFQVANTLVRNANDNAVIEIHSPIKLQTDRAHLIAVIGDARITVNERALPTWTSLFVRGGSLVEIIPGSAWTYLAIHGGVDVPRVMHSRATYTRGAFGGLGRALAVGDEIAIGDAVLSELVPSAGRMASERVRACASRDDPVRVILGPHDDWFTPEAIAVFTESEYVVVDSADRMGYRLRGEPLVRRAGELVSCGVPLGAIQVPADGQPIVLIADHQTTGGYPIIATVIGADMPMLAQKMPGAHVCFRIVEIAEAQRAWREMCALVV